MHASTHIRLGSLKHGLQKKQDTYAGEIVEAAFQEVKPGPGKDYMCHPTIKTFLEKTSLHPLASDKRKRLDYRGSSASTIEPLIAKTWFGRGTLICLDPSQVEAIFRSENVALHQAATLNSAEVITFACAGEASPISMSSFSQFHPPPLPSNPRPPVDCDSGVDDSGSGAAASAAAPVGGCCCASSGTKLTCAAGVCLLRACSRCIAQKYRFWNYIQQAYSIHSLAHQRPTLVRAAEVQQGGTRKVLQCSRQPVR